MNYIKNNEVKSYNESSLENSLKSFGEKNDSYSFQEDLGNMEHYWIGSRDEILKIASRG